MKKWMLSAIIYLLVVMGAYYAYTSIEGSPAQSPDHSDTEQHND